MQELLAQSPYLLAFVIFVARVMDVSLGTVRTIVVFRGYKFLASFIGFFEIIIWLIAAGQVLGNLDQWHLAIAYASGFGAGNYVGISIENRLAIGNELIRCISSSRDVLSGVLRSEGFKVISIEGETGGENPVELLYIVEKRRRVPQLIELIKQIDRSAVYSVSDLKSVYDGPDLLPKRSFVGSAIALPGKRR